MPDFGFLAFVLSLLLVSGLGGIFVGILIISSLSRPSFGRRGKYRD